MRAMRTLRVWSETTLKSRLYAALPSLVRYRNRPFAHRKRKAYETSRSVADAAAAATKDNATVGDHFSRQVDEDLVRAGRTSVVNGHRSPLVNPPL